MASLPRLELGTYCLEGSPTRLRLLNKLTVSRAAELSGLSKSYISQVKHGKCRPSQRLLDAIDTWAGKRSPQRDYLSLFLQSRQAMGVSPRTLGFYTERLTKFTAQVDYQKASRHDIERFLNSIPANQYGLGTRHATYRALKTFYRWLKAEHGVNNPMERMAAPILGKPILPSLARDQVEELLQSVGNNRDKAIIGLFTETGLRLSELARIRASDINWHSDTIRIMGKGRKEALPPLADSQRHVYKGWLAEYQPNGATSGA